MPHSHVLLHFAKLSYTSLMGWLYIKMYKPRNKLADCSNIKLVFVSRFIFVFVSPVKHIQDMYTLVSTTISDGGSVNIPLPEHVDRENYDTWVKGH